MNRKILYREMMMMTMMMGGKMKIVIKTIIRPRWRRSKI
jgi:hypothetical protein